MYREPLSWEERYRRHRRVAHRNDIIFTIITFVIALCFICAFLKITHARDLDGHYAAQNPELHKWFDSRANKNGGLCCSFADGKSIADVDWGTHCDDADQCHYWVIIDGNRYKVPPEAIVEGANKFGPAVVWPIGDENGGTTIRCFMPGAGA